VIYLASPYSDPDPTVRHQRFYEACQATAALISAGHVVYSPIVNSHQLTRHGLPTDWDSWQRFDRHIIARCNALWVLTLPGWQESRGVTAEIAIAEELRLPISYVDQLGFTRVAGQADSSGPLVGDYEPSYLIRHACTERRISAKASTASPDVALASPPVDAS
jgi:hypothetical protein